MLLPGPGSRKAIAATLLLVFFTNTFAPSLSYALTAGPTQPEATNFEPIDTTDMVNLQTGSFTYNTPLLEVPGPEGGYPLAMSYHAGIQPNEDASWVGLGWSLNPGAIDRNVNGYPDDWYAPTATSHTYWAGGSTSTYSVGISVGIANIATVGANLSFAHDTYRGFGVGIEIDASYGIHLTSSISLGLSASIGISPYGDPSASFGVGLSIALSKHLKASLGVQVSTNFETLRAGFTGAIKYGVGSDPKAMRSGTLLGVTIATGGSKPSLNVGGLTASVSNANSGRVSTSSHGFHLDIPVFYGINLSLGYSKQRYWTDEYAGITTWGSLNNLGNGDPTNGNRVWNNFAFDEYSLLESPSYENFIDYPDPTTVQGGSFPDFDQYNVQTQGLSGSMRPYYFQGWLANQNVLNGSTPLVTYYLPGLTPFNPAFRFENDFSNSFRQTENAYADPSSNLRLVPAPMDASPVYGNNDGSAGRSTTSPNALAGSRQVNIGPTIHPRHALGYNKADRYLDYGIEGFSITNESGMTYHFGLPAYTFNEENYQEKIDQSHGATGNRVSKPTQYIYNWYLTTITGPDYVDRNGNGIADDGDWGYWVDFEYGKWGNNYNWRNPSQGYNRDEDNLWQDASMGTREVYYLNAIRTRSHVAIFEKDIRYDAKGASPEIFNKTVVSGIGNAGYTNSGLYNINSSQSLKLSHIYLLNASDENFVTAASGNANAFKPTSNRSYACSDCELPSNVLDRTDVDAVGRAALEAKAIRVIDFNYDYSLCPGTANSFDINYPAVLLGKLSLLNFSDRGKGGANLLPPVSFGYDLGANAVTQTGVTLSTANFTTTNGNFNIGDLTMCNNPFPTFCGVITAKSLVGSTYTYTLTNNTYIGSPTTVTIYTTKDPPYNKDAYDGWGLYKSDYNLTAIIANQNLGRMTTPCSSSSVDAWSLRTITPQLGNSINITYESGQIGTSVLSSPYPFVISSPALDGGLYNKITFTVNTYGYPLTSIAKVGDVGHIVAQVYYKICPVACIYSYIPISTNYTVTAVDGNGTVHATLSTAIQSTNPANSQPYGGILAGNISGNLTQVYGSGIRVNNISLAGSDGTVSTTSYNYNNPTTGNSSGVTSYLPGILDTYDKTTIESLPSSTAAEPAFEKLLYSTVNNLYSLSREMPAPGVIYQYVTVTNQIKNLDEASTRTIEGSTMYQFEVFSPNMVGVVDVTARTGPISTSWGTMFSRNLALDKFTSCIGNLKRSVRYDPAGRKLSETINHYLHDNLLNLPLSSFMSQYKALLAQYNYQGYLQERFYEVKEVTNQSISTNNGVKATLSAREEYPSIQTGQTIVNYVNGTQTSSTNLAFDFYSGAVTQTLETDAYGNNFMSQTVPAYRKYAAMGLKINADGNKNMLTQVAESYRWKVDASNNKLGLISATATTWSDAFAALDIDGTPYTENNPYANQDVWRTQSTYNWISSAQTTDGTTPYASFNDFNFTTPSSSDPNWKNTSTVTLYDVYSKALESTDLNNIHTATRMNYGDQRVILSGGPVNFYEIAFSGAEDAALTQTNAMFVKAVDGTVATGAGVAHTGTQSLQLGVSGKRGFLYSVATNNLTAGRTYQASVWVKPTSGSTSTVGLYYDIDGTIKSSASSSTSTRTANGWTLVNLLINGSDIVAGHTLNVYARNDNATIQAYVDDFRFQPQNSTTTAYVYDPFSGELDYILDNSNLYTQYVYDGVGRLINIFREKLGTGVFKTTQEDYNYGMTQYGSTALNTSYYKNNCPVNYAGTGVVVNYPQGTYNSFISQADADNRSFIYAQDYANTHATCVCAPTFTYSSGITPIIVNTMSQNGTNVAFTYVFGWPSGATTVNLGNIVGSCAYPTSTRTIPINSGSQVFNVVVSSTGNVTVNLVSGPVPSGNIGVSRSYDINTNAFYSALASGGFTRNNCPAGQTGSGVTYTVAANAYSSLISQADANTQAQNDVNANGQNYANANGICTVNCGFTWNGGFASTSANIGSSGTTGSFTLSFMPTSGTYTGGTLGTITGGCKPSATRVLTVPDVSHSGRTWTVTITSAGTFSVSLASGTGQIFQSPPAVISGNYAL